MDALLVPTSEFMYGIILTLFERFKITAPMLSDLLRNKLPMNFDLLHPADRKLLRVTTDNSDHLKECEYGDLVVFMDGSKTDLGVGAAAVYFQYPDL